LIQKRESMGRLDQMRRGIERLIEEDRDIGIITRDVTKPGDRPGQNPMPTGEKTSHKIICRVGYQSGGVWPGRQWEGGLAIDTSPYVLAMFDADLEQGDTLEWRKRKYAVGVVSRPEFGGGPTCTQAPLTEVA
jgi:hypothetical protein